MTASAASPAGTVRVVNPATELDVAEVSRQDEEAADAAVRRAAAGLSRLA